MSPCLRHPAVRPVLWRAGAACVAAALAVTLAAGSGGCGNRKPTYKAPVSRYAALPAREVPAFMKGTIYEKADLINTEPFAVSGFGLVVNLRGTGNSNAPSAVRDYMIREMVKHGIGTYQIPGYEKLQPEEMLRDPRVAIVRVDGQIPPGARAGQKFDVHVSALEQSYTTSLAHGRLFDSDLRINGANEIRPGGSVNVLAGASGPVFVNPAYALDTNPQRGTQRNSLRQGVVLDGGIANQDMPLALRLRQPQYSTARAIEQRIDERFQAIADKAKKSATNLMGAAAAADDGIVYLYVPGAFRGDWEHFGEVVKHLYLTNSPDFTAIKARELAQEAVKPEALLHDISYCWEALGPAALPQIQPLMAHEKPEVAYAAARAAACIGDRSGSAEAALLQMAQTPDHPFQLNAVQTLGSLPPSAMLHGMLRKLLTSEQTLVRLEAYRVLARNGDGSVYSKVVGEQFVLDLVPGDGPPLVYASQQGLPRIAVMGERIALQEPVLFTAMDKRLMISSNEERPGAVTIFYRPPLTQNASGPASVSVESRTELGEVIARLGGQAPRGEDRLDFSYSDVVAMVQAMAKERAIVAMPPAVEGGEPKPVPFVLQQLPEVDDSIYNAPIIPDQARPQEADARLGAMGEPAAASTAAEAGTTAAASPDLKPMGGDEDSGKNAARESETDSGRGER